MLLGVDRGAPIHLDISAQALGGVGEQAFAAWLGGRAQLGLAQARSPLDQRRQLAAQAVGRIGLNERDEHREIVIVAEKLRQMARLRCPRPEIVGPGARQERHLPPVGLRAFAPLVEGLVARVAVRLRECAPRAAVGALQAGADDVEARARDLQADKTFLRLGEPRKRLARAEWRALAVRGRDRLAERLRYTLAAKARRALELIDRFEQHVPVARARQAQTDGS